MSEVNMDKEERRCWGAATGSSLRSSSPPLLLLLALCLLVCLCCIHGGNCQTLQGVQEELDTLKVIGTKIKANWNYSEHPCNTSAGWGKPALFNDLIAFSVNCTCTPISNTTSLCRVANVVLKGQNYSGSFPEQFANLTSLSVLDLSRNCFNGSIPTKWATLPLTQLSLLGNRISGGIPKELGNITTLQSLILQNTLVEGTIPDELGNLANLNRLHLSGNNLSGSLPQSFGNLTNLTEFRIDGSPITGKIPAFIGNWTKLTRLDMQGTSLKGPFPPTFSKLTSLKELRVTDCTGGDGEFPALDNMIDLTSLVLRNLSISGVIPDFLVNMNNLKFLDLSFNNLSGGIPNGLKNVKYMYFTSNKLNGSIPDWILTSQRKIDLSYNSFTGNNPPSTCNPGDKNFVSSYSTSPNSNSITQCLRRNQHCSGKAKNYNLFINCGGIAMTIGDNDYEADTTPLGPSHYEASASGKWAYSSTGNFIGDEDAPYIVNNISALRMNNSALYTRARVNPLSLKYYGLCLQKGNYSVVLHFAEIMFTDDKTFASNGRRLFDVSIQGQKVLRDFNIAKEANGTGKELKKNFTAIVDEDGTLEIHFQWAGKGTNSIPQKAVYGPLVSAISVTPNFKPDLGNNKLSTGAIVGIVVGASVAILIILAAIWLFFRRKNHQYDEFRGLELHTGTFSLRQIKAATKDFDTANKIGEGGFGPVYKGVLPDGSVIAVKQLSSKSRQGNREFINEIGMISALQHPNLVKLYGCCIEGNQLLLVYEYMENNSLARALFGPEGYRLNLSWDTRRMICIGIARGLAYLHEESRLKIVHRDIKATNVLLDKDLNAKISDFGLAKLDDEENTHISTRIAGTIGYMAPEYAMRGYLSDKADVYSFGVVALEIVSGMSNTNYRPKEEFVYLLDWAYVLQEQGNLLELVDTSLGPNYSKEEALQMLNLALLCTNPSPTLRPTMSTVVSMLEGKTPVTAPPRDREASASGDGIRFKAFQNVSHDSHTQSDTTEGPWIDSSPSVASSVAVSGVATE